mmetsp:Transcript_38255/g.95066  ORF Transcript_38255/g.95066 Transcript_38255/m.95066 type:complete len:357 (+) Transcript_38255:746-1816(+)
MMSPACSSASDSMRSASPSVFRIFAASLGREPKLPSALPVVSRSTPSAPWCASRSRLRHLPARNVRSIRLFVASAVRASMACAALAPEPRSLIVRALRCHGMLAAMVRARPSQCCKGRPRDSHATHAAVDSVAPISARTAAAVAVLPPSGPRDTPSAAASHHARSTRCVENCENRRAANTSTARRPWSAKVHAVSARRQGSVFRNHNWYARVLEKISRVHSRQASKCRQIGRHLTTASSALTSAARMSGCMHGTTWFHSRGRHTLACPLTRTSIMSRVQSRGWSHGRSCCWAPACIICCHAPCAPRRLGSADIRAHRRHAPTTRPARIAHSAARCAASSSRVTMMASAHFCIAVEA